MKQVSCLACSTDESLLFVAGGQDDNFAKPSIAAVTFDATLQLVVETELDFSGLSMVYSIKTFEESNLLFLGCYSSILIVYYHEEKFAVITQVKDVVADEVNLLRYIDNHLYVGSPSKAAVVQVAFSKLAADNRRKSVLGVFSPEFVALLTEYERHSDSLRST